MRWLLIVFGLLLCAGLVWAGQNLLPGYGVVDEVDSSENLLPGYGVVNESVAVAGGGGATIHGATIQGATIF